VLIEAYLGRYARELDKSLQRVSPEALKVLLEYPWPGNVRELQNILRKSLLNLSGSVLLPEFLPEEIRASSDIASAHSSSSRPMATADDGDLPRDLGAFLQDRLDSCSENVYAEAVEFMERYVVTRVLQSTGGNQSKAAKILGITRGSLRNKTHSLGIKIGQVVSSASVDEEEEGGE
jgi:two-component system nitrogen regulation response regulator GlnG